jgi:hypothetical protein
MYILYEIYIILGIKSPETNAHMIGLYVSFLKLQR